jgi:hypothetical protein
VSVPVFVRADLFGVLTVYVDDTTSTDETVSAVGLLAQEVGLLLAHGPLLTQPAFRTITRPTIAAVS